MFTVFCAPAKGTALTFALRPLSSPYRGGLSYDTRPMTIQMIPAGEIGREPGAEGATTPETLRQKDRRGMN